MFNLLKRNKEPLNTVDHCGGNRGVVPERGRAMPSPVQPKGNKRGVTKNLGETHKDSPIYEPDVVHDLEMIVGCLSDATRNGSYMIVVPERIIKTDIEKLYKVLQTMGVGCFIQHCYSDSISENTRALRIFNDERG
ncbi:hypothetical protein [Latilactobacillus sakei]|uniref:hypothetical protein n=1 Tax=Latilactobacillus sakei TaxID=1599 RepID=UPI000B9D7178|nr:hypothetical protein [Latilactobacillus sakei]BAX67894.1 hypothetical protein LASAK_00486 [Latilactobacillus sakei]